MRGHVRFARLDGVAKSVRFRWCEPVDRLRNPATLQNGLHPLIGQQHEVIDRQPFQLSSQRWRAAHAIFPEQQTVRRPKALFLDACGTFLIPSESVTDVYRRYAELHGVPASHLANHLILQGFRRAYNAPPDQQRGPLRYNGDGRSFWRRVVAESLGSDNEALFEDIYNYYATPSAWTVPPGLRTALARIHEAGVKICVVSNFDQRLRSILQKMQLSHFFDEVVVSCEVGAEKPNPRIFEEACRRSGVDANSDFIIHVGDDRRNDVWGARDSGLTAWHWGEQVTSFDEIAERVVTGHTDDT